MLCQPVIEAGRTHASIVMPVVRSSEAAGLIVIQSFTPSNDSPPPKRPAVVHVAPEIVPVLPDPDVSPTVGPAPSLKLRAATSPAGLVANVEGAAGGAGAIAMLDASSIDATR